MDTRASEIDRVKYVKESSRVARVSRLIRNRSEGHAQYFTTMQMLLASISSAARCNYATAGAYIANAIIEHSMPATMRRRPSATSVRPMAARWMSYGLAPALKAAMEIVGLPLGNPRHSSPCRTQTKRQCGYTLRHPFVRGRAQEVIGNSAA